MDFREFLKNNIVILDGAMGTLLQNGALAAGELPERLNLSHPELIKDIHLAYFDAGANVVATNTFGANALKFSDEELYAIVCAAVKNAKDARALSCTSCDKFVALDIGPTGKLLKPLGELEFETAVEIFAKTVKIAAECGVDLIIIETMNDSLETKAAVLAARENSSLPIIVTNAYGADSKLMTGADPLAMVSMLEGLSVDAIGANCSLGARELMSVIKELLSAASIPIVFKPNAGLPRIVDGKTVFSTEPEEFADVLSEAAALGVRALGGCCGTSPQHIRALAERVSGIAPVPISKKARSLISSYTHAVSFDKSPILIGERINPTGKKRVREAILNSDFEFILTEALKQAERGAHVLDVNVGIPDCDEAKMLPLVVKELQAVTDLPLQLDSPNPKALEAAMRIYNGKPMINSVSGKRESMESIFPLVKKYGGFVVALTLDEDGIPETAEGRVEIAKRIIKTAKEYGIEKSDLIFDTLTMTVSASPDAASVTLKALRIINEELGCKTTLGVSNVSFGLPERDALNSSFFTLALGNGLSAAIMNPYSDEMMRAYYSFRALTANDENFSDFIENAPRLASSAAPAAATGGNSGEVGKYESELQYAIIKGLSDKAFAECRSLLERKAALDIVESEIIPALNVVGAGFELGKIYLPSLLMSAEAAKRAFSVIKSSALDKKENTPTRAKFVIATVKGDIHDIGKNIVKLMLENYGYDVIDLGKDVAAERVLNALKNSGAPLLGLSALMTTTVPSMEETVKLVKSELPNCKIIVGGAVLTEEYAQKMGADAYAADAMETVRAAEKLLM